MDLQQRFFGMGVPKQGGPVVANPHLTDAPSLQLLFPNSLDLNAEALTLALRDYHSELASATAELLPFPASQSSTKHSTTIMGLIGWGRHVIKLVGYDSPMDAGRVRTCVQPSHYDPELKEEAYRHTAHIILHYAGYEQDPVEQHVALAATSAALARSGALIVMNETARCSIPAMVLQPHEEDEGDTMRAMRSLPLPLIYAGFVLLEIEGESGVWMRTYGCNALRLPDLAMLVEGHEQAPVILDLFSNMLGYLRSTGKSFVPGDRIGIGEGQFFRFRTKSADDWFLESAGELLVVERIKESEVD